MIVASAPAEQRPGAILADNVAAIELEPEPFPHAVMPELFTDEASSKLLEWFETEAEWEVQESSFYLQHRCTNVDDIPSSGCAEVVGPETMGALVALLGRVFSTTLDPWNITVAAHKLLPGQGIGIHTDEPDLGTETHRLVVHVNRTFDDSYGGHLMLFYERDPSAIAKIIRPVNNSAAAFALSDRSFHAVNDVADGVRYSVVFGFWEAGKAPGQGVEPIVPAEDRRLALDGADRLVAYLSELGAADKAHSGRNLLAHLIGTATILERWGCSPSVCTAGLFHSVYGTTTFNVSLIGPGDREQLRTHIGLEAERLAYLFCFVDRMKIHTARADGSMRAELRDGLGEEDLSPDDIAALRLLVYANVLDQAPFMKLTPEESLELREELLTTMDTLPEPARADLERALAT